jgi:hypothetical protein
VSFHKEAKVSDCTFIAGHLLDLQQIVSVLRDIPEIENFAATKDFSGRDSFEAFYVCSDGTWTLVE